MKTLRWAKLLLSLFPLTGTAQELPSLAPTADTRATPLVEELLSLDASGRPKPEPASPVLPIWSSSDGQLLAVVALPRGWTGALTDPTPGYEGSSAWQLVGGAANAEGLRWQLTNGFRAETTFGQYLSSAPASCTSTFCDAASALRGPRASLSGTLGMGWTAADSGLDLSYGLSWLQSQSSGTGLTALAPAFGAGVVPVVTLPDAQPYALDSEASLFARGRWHFQQGPALDVAASYGRGRFAALGPGGLASPMAPGVDLDQLSLSLGLDAGSLRGAIVGHVISSDDPALAGKRWTTLDLGVSWRTPWSGEFSVGAQNLLGSPLSSSREGEVPQVRTPYIQYRQDL